MNKEKKLKVMSVVMLEYCEGEIPSCWFERDSSYREGWVAGKNVSGYPDREVLDLAYGKFLAILEVVELTQPTDTLKLLQLSSKAYFVKGYPNDWLDLSYAAQVCWVEKVGCKNGVDGVDGCILDKFSGAKALMFRVENYSGRLKNEVRGLYE